MMMSMDFFFKWLRVPELRCAFAQERLFARPRPNIALCIATIV
jgi:hypothetical protein